MSDQFLTIKEAADRYQKAEITIRRLVRSVVQKDDKDAREFIRPTPTEVQALKKKSKPFSYSIHADLLENHYSDPATASATPKKSTKDESLTDKEFFELLKKTNDSLSDQLKVKDQQIHALNQTLDDLSERQRETNILMKGFQEQFVLKSGSSKQEQVEDAVAAGKNRWWSNLWK